MNYLNYFSFKTLKYDLINKFSYNKTKSLPELKKIILNFSCKNTHIKTLSSNLLALELIAFKKGELTKTKKSNILLKIRKGNPVGCKVILKNFNMFTFLERFACEVLTRISNTHKLNFSKSKNKKSFSFEMSNVFCFKELEKNYQLFNEINKIDITIVINSKFKKEMIFILNSLKLIN